MPRRVLCSIAFLCAFGLIAAVPAASAGDVSHARIVRLSYTLGDVKVSADGVSGWHKAIVNTPLREGMSLATGDGRAEVEFESGAMAWMASNTVLEFPQLALEDGAKNTQLTVKQGTATFYVNPGRHDSFVVQAGQMLIAAPDNAKFRVDAFQDGTAVSALHGAVEVTTGGNAQRVNGHKTLSIRSNDSAGAVLGANPRSDGWDRWVSTRFDSVDAARLNSTDYLDSPVGYGMADLSYYGGFVSLPGYGTGWQPYGVGLGWSPFYNGYWDSFGAFGPTWVSNEPWGWLPYHYGGWLFSPLYGWVWSPGGFGAWSPGSVFWANTPTGIGWVPRAPHEPANGTPVNLTRGVVTNTAAGMLAGSRNTILRGPDLARVQMVGDAQGNAELSRLSQQMQAQAATRAPAASVAKGLRSAPRMPQGAAPRIATAGMFAGRVQTYIPPSPPRGSSRGFGSGAPSYQAPSVPSSSASSGSHGEASSSRASSGGGGGHGKP